MTTNDYHDAFRDLAESGPAVFYARLPEGEYAATSVSPNVALRLGYTPEEMTGAPGFWADRLHPEDRPRVLSALETLAAQESRRLEYRFRHKDGSYRWLQDDTKLVADDNGLPRALIGSWLDISASREAQNDLELRLAETDRALHKATRRAQDSDRANSAFLTNISHAIRTPMNGVVGMAELLMRTNLKTEQKRMVRTVRKSSLSLLRMIDDILDVSKIEAGKIEVSSAPIRLRDVVEDVIETQRPAATFGKVRLGLKIDPAVPDYVLGDAPHLRQVLLNLMSNAVKFSGRESQRSGGKVDLSVLRRGANYLIVVSDNGPGMSPEEVARLFTPFEENESPLPARRVGSLGLGMVVVDKLVKMLDGAITVDSAPGEGTRFTVTLPCVEAQGEARDPDISGLSLLAHVPDSVQRDAIGSDVARAGAEVHFCTDEGDLRRRAGDADAGTLVMLASETAAANARLCQELAARNPGLRFLSAIPDMEQRGACELPGCHVIQSAPVLPSELIRGIAILAGRADPGPEEDAPLPRPASSGAKGDGARILVVEDNMISRDVITKQCDVLGHVVDVAENGAEGLEKLKAARYDLVLLDCHMPVMDGFEMTEQLRKHERETGFQHTPIVAISANVVRSEAQRCMAAGMDAFLGKPVELFDLNKALAAWLPKRPKPLRSGRVKLNVTTRKLN